MLPKTRQSAVAVIPPGDVWEPIQAIRRRHDRQIGRWMPHVNLLYPFVAAEQFAEAIPRLEDACASVAPFEVTLAELRSFSHPSGSATLWLAPEPRAALVGLQAVLQTAFPGCDDLSRYPAGFTPHLSVGQFRSLEALEEALSGLRLTWRPLRFEVSAIEVIRRGRDTPFEVVQWIPLAGGRVHDTE